MDFHTWKSSYNFMKQKQSASKDKRFKIVDPSDYYEKFLAHLKTQRPIPHIDIYHLETEWDWFELKRPYYNVWPGIIPLLTKIDLDLPSHLVAAPLSTINLRFPVKNNPLSFKANGKDVFATGMLLSQADNADSTTTFLQLWIDIGEVSERGNPATTMRMFPLSESMTVEQALNELGEDPSAKIGIEVPNAFFSTMVRLACTVCLLADDPQIIEPDVLADDRVKFEETRDIKYVEKAHRRGKLGWNVGEKFEAIPHYRRPHPALFWTGKGRLIPKIGIRKGSIVNRTIVGDIPTGYLDE